MMQVGRLKTMDNQKIYFIYPKSLKNSPGLKIIAISIPTSQPHFLRPKEFFPADKNLELKSSFPSAFWRLDYSPGI